MYTARLPQYTWLGLPLWLPLPGFWGTSTNPRTAIQPGIMPGECWAFQGSEGYLVIKLAMPMKPTRFSIEHIPKSLSPTGKIDSAPKDFLVLGLQQERDTNPTELGQYSYDQNGEPLQFFEIEKIRQIPYRKQNSRLFHMWNCAFSTIMETKTIHAFTASESMGLCDFLPTLIYLSYQFIIYSFNTHL